MRRVATLTLAAAALAAAPLALPAQQTVDSVTVSYELDGLRILHRRTDARVFAANLYLLGGVRQVTPATAGIEPFLLEASEYGTKAYPGTATRRAAGRTGSSFAVDANEDWTLFSISGVREEFDSTWAVFADRLLHPALDSGAVETVRRRSLAAAKRQLSSPDRHAMRLAQSLAFGDHPYAIDPRGTEASIGAMTEAGLRAYAEKEFVKSRMLLVVVGDIPRERLDALVAATLGALPRGSYQWTMPTPVRATKPAVVAVHRPSSTNYVVGFMHGPQVSSPEHPAYQYAMMILNDFVSSVIRESEGLSYAAYVPTMERGLTGAAIFLSTTRPDTVAKLINFIFDQYEDEIRIPGYAFKRASDSFRTAYLFGMETASSHADMLARAQLYQGDYRAAATRNEIMAKVRFTEVRRIIRDYGKNIQYAYVGDTIRLPRATMMKR